MFNKLLKSLQTTTVKELLKSYNSLTSYCNDISGLIIYPQGENQNTKMMVISAEYKLHKQENKEYCADGN